MATEREIRSGLTQARLKELFDYDPITGVFLRRVGRRGRARAGHPAGYLNCDGYLRVMVDYNRLVAHRLAWFWMTGEWPTDQIDHIDGDRSNNRFANLRQASHRENNRNMRLSSLSTSGLKGAVWDVSWSRWKARIKVDGRQIYLGSFKTAEDAHAAYVVAATNYFGEFARTA